MYGESGFQRSPLGNFGGLFCFTLRLFLMGREVSQNLPARSARVRDACEFCFGIFPEVHGCSGVLPNKMLPVFSVTGRLF